MRHLGRTRTDAWDSTRLSLIVVAISAFVPITVVATLALSNRFQADDFSIAARQKTFGIAGAWIEQVRVVNGRFAGFLFADILTLLGPHRAAFATWLLMVALVGAVWAALPGSGDDIVRRSAMTGCIVAAVVLTAPTPEQAFLWISALGMVTAGIVLAVAAVAAGRRSVDAGGRRKGAWLGAAGGAAFLASGAYETTGLFVIVLSAAAIVAFDRHDRARIVAAATVGAGAILGFLLVAAMPGTSHRKTFFDEGLPPVDAVEEGVRRTGPYLQGLLRKEAIWLALGAGLLAAAPRVPFRRAVRYLVSAAVGTSLALSAGFALSLWSIGFGPVARTQTAFVATFAAFLFVVGWFVPLHRVAMPLVAVVLVAVSLHSSGPLWDRVERRREWAEKWDRRHALLSRAPPDGVVELPVLASPAGLEDFGANPRFWVNAAAARYYGVEAIVAVPRAPR